MTKGPNSFFIAPDSDFILEGTITSSNDATGLYTSKTVAATSNSGSMSSFMIGTPESNTTYKLKIQDSGSNYSGTYIYKLSTSEGSDDSLLWYGEPDRRYMWDIHNPLLQNYTQSLDHSSVSPPSGYFWENSVRNENIVSIQGVYFSVLNKEFLYASTFDDFVPKLWVTSRSISNQEQHWDSGTQITTLTTLPDVLSNALQMNAIDSNKRGLTTNYEPTYSICEHIDGKLKLAVRYNEDIDIYESTDGISFTLIAKNILSRFRNQRFVSHLKMASSGPYLKIAFVNELEPLKKQQVRFLGTLTSSDGGASWDYTDIAKSIQDNGAGIVVLNSNNSLGSQNYCYDLCGLSDGSGKFILVNGQSLIEDNKRDGRVEKEIGTGNYVNFAVSVNQGTSDPFYMSCYVASGNGKLYERTNLSVQNTEMSAKPFIATSNDWIWLMVGGCKTNPVSGLRRQQIGSLHCSEAYSLLTGFDPEEYSPDVSENTMFYLRIDSDLSKDKWKKLGVNDFDVPDPSDYFTQKLGEPLKSGRATTCMGSYFFIPASGNLYSCASYMAFCAVGWPINNKTLQESEFGLDIDYGSFLHSAQYYRFSGWVTRPPYINLGLNPVAESRLDSVDKFIHQEKGLILVCDYNYIFGKPRGVGNSGEELSRWGQRRIGTAFSSLREDCLQFQHIVSSGLSFECNFYYYRTSTVCHALTWSKGAGQRVGSVTTGVATNDINDTDFRYPMFPLSMTVNDYHTAPQSCWTQAKRNRNDANPDGCCIEFVFGGVNNGSVAKNSIGIKINSFTRGIDMPAGASLSGDAILYEYFLRMAGDRIALYNTANNAHNSDYRNSAGTLEVFTMILDSTKFGSDTFENCWWQGRLSFNTRKGIFSVKEMGVSLSIRKLGTNLVQDSGEFNFFTDDAGKIVANLSSSFVFLGFQGISFGLFPDEDGTLNRKVKFRTLKVCQGSTMQQANFQRNSDHSDRLPPVVNLIRGRKMAPNPAYIGTGQSIVWGGIGGKFNDTFDTKIKSSYNVENTIKVSSPRFEYRTKGDNTSDIKSSKAEIVYQLSNSTRTSNSLSGYQLNHTGLAILNTNVEKIKIEYDDNSSFTSPYVVGEKSLKLISARVDQASNNRIRVIYDGESSVRNSNRNQYTSSENTTYYLKFTTNAGVSLLNKSYKINKTFGGNILLDIPDNVLSTDPTLCPAGTTIEIYSDRMISTQAISDQTYMRITLTGHLGTTDYIKMGSLTAGTSFNLDRVPINWEHSVNVSGNVTEFNSRSGVRWAYKEGPSVRTFTGDIIGDVFDDERENIENIAKEATQFNIHPVAMVFDSGRGSSFETGSDSTAKAYIDPTNILYGTINPELQMVNEGWRYDESNSEWKVIGNLQLTIIEVV